MTGLLKQVQLSPKLGMLITQEAIFNDPTAFIYFNLVLKLYLDSSHSYDSNDTLIYILTKLLASPCVGLAFGLLTVAGLYFVDQKLNKDDVIIQVVLTISCAYLSFYVAEETIHASGALSCCAAGICIAWLGPPLILEHESMNSIWEMLVWISSTLICFLAGCLVK